MSPASSSDWPGQALEAMETANCASGRLPIAAAVGAVVVTNIAYAATSVVEEAVSSGVAACRSTAVSRADQTERCISFFSLGVRTVEQPRREGRGREEGRKGEREKEKRLWVGWSKGRVINGLEVVCL